MSAEGKTSMTSTIILITLGIAALCVSSKWLVVLIPAAILVWYATCPRLGSGRS